MIATTLNTEMKLQTHNIKWNAAIFIIILIKPAYFRKSSWTKISLFKLHRYYTFDCKV